MVMMNKVIIMVRCNQCDFASFHEETFEEEKTMEKSQTQDSADFSRPEMKVITMIIFRVMVKGYDHDLNKSQSKKEKLNNAKPVDKWWCC